MKLGQVTYIDDIRSVWGNEAKDFTPWLAENLDALGAELGIDMELITTEYDVGSFSLDIYAREINTGHPIVVENQLETTDHSHLGQLITYSSGVDAKIIIWISKTVREEHRKAIDSITIDGSLPAPLFKVKASPNEWGKAQKANFYGWQRDKDPEAIVLS